MHRIKYVNLRMYCLCDFFPNLPKYSLPPTGIFAVSFLGVTHHLRKTISHSTKSIFVSIHCHIWIATCDVSLHNTIKEHLTGFTFSG